MAEYLDGLEKPRRSERPFDLEGSASCAEGASAQDDPGTVAELTRSVEQRVAAEIISRLLVAHRVGSPLAAQVTLEPTLAPSERERFVALVMRQDADGAHALLDELLDRGVPYRELLLELLGDAAQRFGELWEEDRADFTEVTLGLCSLHQLLRERRWSGDEGPYTAQRRSILLAGFGGEQHILGVMIVAEVFRQAGWQVAALPGASPEQLCGRVRESEFDVIGLSAADLACVDTAAREISALRAASSNKDIKVIVGGQAFAEQRDLFHRLGADAWAADVELAPALAAGLQECQKTRN